MIQATFLDGNLYTSEVPVDMMVCPFGKVSYWDLPGGRGRRVQATILTDFVEEQVEFGLALSNSCSMQTWFESGHLDRVAQKLGGFLAQRDGDGIVPLIYWGDGERVQKLGDLPDSLFFNGLPSPSCYTSGDYLLPALKYFIGGQSVLQQPQRKIFVFVTGGGIEDCEAVIRYSVQLAKGLDDDSRRERLKLLLLGLGDHINKAQFDALGSTSLWHTMRLADIKDLEHPYEIFAELVEPSCILVPNDGIVRDGNGQVATSFRDTGLPAVVQFILPPDNSGFSLEVAGKSVWQPLPPVQH
jgi:hypothetical protein